MEKQITYRKFQNSDSQALENIIRETWQYDKLCSPKTAARLANVYLNSCLSNQTFTQVAVDRGVPVGIIMGKNRKSHKCPLRLRLRLMSSVISLCLSKEGRSVSKIFSCVEDIDDALLKSSPIQYPGEVAFFAVSSRYRGRGVGKKLFQALLSYMEAQDIHDFFLFTDTSCNYQFYEYQGMVRRGEHTHTFEAKGQSGTLTLFLYDYQF